MTLSTTLSVDTNPGLVAVSPGTEFDASETLTFSLLTETNTQLLEVFGGAALSFTTTSGGGSSTSVTSPNVTLHYFRDGAESNLDFTANYWSGDVTSTFNVSPTSAVVLIVDVGTLDVSGGTVAYNWGLNAPLSFSVNASIDQRDYSGTTDPALFDSTTVDVSADAGLRISPTTQGRLTASLIDYDSSDAFATSRETTSLRFDVTHDLATALTINGNIGYRQKSTTASGATTTSGLIAGVDLTQSLPNGTVFGGLQFDDSNTLTSTALTVGRSFDLPAASFSANLTVDKQTGLSTQIIGNATYTQQLPDGALSIDFSQSLFENTLSQDIKLTRLGIGYQKALNSDSDLDISLDLRRTEDAATGVAATQNRASLSAAYSRTLTPDWDLSVGYTRQQNSGSAVVTANSDKVFLRLTRDIQFGF